MSLSVGDPYEGLLKVLEGGNVTCVGLNVSVNSTGWAEQGTVEVDGEGSTLTCSGKFFLGRTGHGVLRVTDGGSVFGGSLYAASDQGSTGEVLVDGARSTLAAAGIDLGEAGLGTLVVQNGGTVSNTHGAELGVYGIGEGGATVTGPGSTWTNAGGLTVGKEGVGTLNIQDGGVVSSVTGYIGSTAYGSGTVTVDGPGTAWSSSADLYIGGGAGSSAGIGNVTVQNGGTLGVGGTLKLWDRGTLTLDNGVVDAGTLDVLSGRFDWLSGTVRVTGPAGLTVAPGTGLGNRLYLLDGQSLDVTHELSVPTGEFLVTTPGSFLSAHTLRNDGAVTLLAPAVFGAGGVSNHGLLGVDLPHVDFGGGLTNTTSVMLLNTTVDGAVHSLSGSTTAIVDTVTFNDPVSGGGDFVGDGTVKFTGGYSPGDSPAAVAFEGSVALGPDSFLQMEILGHTQGIEYDWLDVQGDITLGGGLELIFNSTFAESLVPADQFILISAGGVLSGQFANALPGATLEAFGGAVSVEIHYGPGSAYGADNVVLTSFIQHYAIPEPASLGLLGLGALVLGRRRTKRRA